MLAEYCRAAGTALGLRAGAPVRVEAATCALAGFHGLARPHRTLGGMGKGDTLRSRERFAGRAVGCIRIRRWGRCAW